MGIESMHCLATLENLALVTDFMEGCAERFGLDIKKKFGLLVAVEEAFVNICSYAYADEEGGEVELACESVGNALVLNIADSGEPFDVLSLPGPDTTKDFMDREVGGLGVHFIRQLSDSASYRRENGKNILRLEFRRVAGDIP